MTKSNKFIFSGFLVVAVCLGLFNSAALAHAMVPSLSVSYTGTGDNVQINVNGDPNASVVLFAASQTVALGTTNSSGAFTTTISSAAYNILSNAIVYVKTGGLNGTQSQSTSWPYIQGSGSSTGNFTLSQTALLLNAGQTSTITASANYLYVLSNSNPAVANINLNASQITVTANTYGSTVANLCVVGSTTNCQSITITVQNSGAQQLNFSQNNFSIVSGQTVQVTVSGGSGSYTISNNSNPSSVQASLSGQIVSLTSNNTNGAASITVCTTDLNNCGIINVNSTTVSSNAVTFSQTNPVVPVGQTTTVTIYGGTGTSFYVSSNSNPSIVQANINNNILTLIGNGATGSSNISVCAYQGTCASLTANVSNTSSNGQMSLSQNSISILEGQSSNITILGGSTPYSVSAPSSSNVFNAVVSGNTLTVYGVNAGSATANVCSSIGCTTLSVTINSATSSNNQITFSQNNILLNAGQQTTVYVSSVGNNYYVANASAPSVASVTISGSTISIYADASGTDTISICQSSGQCSTLYITVSGMQTNTGTQLSLSPTSLTLAAGQSGTAYLTGNGGYYISNNSNSGIASAQISGTSVLVSAIGIGTANISICQSSGQCSVLYVTVSNAQTNTGAQLALSQTSLSLNAGQSNTVYITGNGSYYISTNSNIGIASVQLSTTSAVVSGLTAGTTNISICQIGGQCAVLYVTVSGTPANVVAPATGYFTRYLFFGVNGEDVLQLQKILVAKGFLSATPNGHFGAATRIAVKKLQKENNLSQLGAVGPATRAVLNQIYLQGQ